MNLFEKKVSEYLLRKKWKKGVCPICGSLFYSKKNSATCQSYECTNSFSFLDYSKPKHFIFLDTLHKETRDFFKSKNFKMIAGINAINKLGDTFFIVAGVQFLDEVFHKNGVIPSGSFFIAQPSIRTKFLRKKGFAEGYSTSFVNVCTEEVNSTIDRYIESLDTWLDYFSYIGLLANDLTLVKKDTVCTEDITSFWSKLKGNSLFFNYGGLELGDGSYIWRIPQKNRDSLTLIDFGFGLERICWAKNKSDSYFDAIGPLPLSLKGNTQLIDCVRTITLMTSSGVVPKQRPQGPKLTQFVRKYLSLKDASYDICSLISYYYSFWSMFFDQALSLKACQVIIKAEVDRCRNMVLCQSLGSKPQKMRNIIDKSTDEFIRYLVSCRNQNIDSIRKAL